MDPMHLFRLVNGSKFMSYRDWYYEFSSMPAVFDDDAMAKVGASLSQRYARLARQWNADLNSEWLVRHYFAAKLIMASCLAVNALEYAEDCNLRLVVPYLRYYAVLSVLRSAVLTIPEAPWQDGGLLEMSHAKAINLAMAHLGALDKSVAATVADDVRRLKAERELISYRAPSGGDWVTAGESARVHEICRLMAEVAQFNSELLELSIERYGDPTTFVVTSDAFDLVASVTLEGLNFEDRDDEYRFGYLARKHPLPANLQHTMTEGHVDDFFGAWAADGDTSGLFDPDVNARSIFSML